ncbi:hypothetical protein PtB15_4B361 [Puccinia triticina]|nr:hypothetical protein PtB15_4B361 [Puccinia triticina]
MPHGHEVVTQEAESSRAFPREAVPLVKSEVSSPGGAVHCKKRPPITPFFPDQGSQAAPSLRKRFRLSFTTLPTSSTGNIDAMKTPLMILVALHCSLLCLGGKSSSKASGKYVTCASYDFSQSPNVCTDQTSTAWRCETCTGSITAHGCRLNDSKQEDPDTVDCAFSFGPDPQSNDRKQSSALSPSLSPRKSAAA